MPAKIASEKAHSLQVEFFGNDLREQAVLSKLGSLLTGHSCFIDLGANVGQYSYFANTILRDAEIISVEANPNLIDLLEETMRRANAENPNNNVFKILNNIVSDSAQPMDFYIDPTATTSSIFRGDQSKALGATRINSITLDELYRPGRRTFIKMDIEGAEYRALLCARRLLASSNATFLIEVHPWGDPERRRYPLHLGALMFLNGYKMTKIVPHYFFGSHYIFTKSTRLLSLLSFIYFFPVLFVEFIIYRFFSNNAESVTEFLRTHFKRRKTQSSRC